MGLVLVDWVRFISLVGCLWLLCLDLVDWLLSVASFDTFTAVIFQVEVFWVVTPCSVL